MGERQGVEIDYCPKCRGTWLDRGELDQILEKSLRNSGPASNKHEGYGRLSDDEDRSEHGRGGRRREGFLGELLDFG